MTQGPERTAPAALVPPHGDRSLQIIFDCLLNEYSIDFSRYKPATMSRRMWRRLGIFGLQHLGDYVQALHASPQERHALARDLLERFFGKEQNRYRVRRQLCDMVHFIPHNLMQDPPFTHVSFISCRNCLIYLKTDVQQHILGCFADALRQPGYLLLGPSESCGPLSSAFRSAQGTAAS